MVLLGCLLSACRNGNPSSTQASASAVEATNAEDAQDSPPLVLPDTATHTVADSVTGRIYPLWVALPASYGDEPGKRYPVLYATDAPYSFALVRSIRNLVGQRGRNIEDFILVGLPPQEGLSHRDSRLRDYTISNPLGKPGRNAEIYSGSAYGEADRYRDYLQRDVFALVEKTYRTDPARRLFAGHSVGGLFGAHVLLTKPEMFSAYILSSPSLWFDQREIWNIERAYAEAHNDLPARVTLYIGMYETRGDDARYYKNADMVGDNRAFQQLLQSRGYPGLEVHGEVVADEDHFTVYPSAITRALIRLLPGKGPYSSG